MKTYSKCLVCKEYHYTDQKCLPIFLVSHEYYLGDKEKEVRANDHEEAAEKYAKYYNDSGDYPMMNGEPEITIQVRKYDEEKRTTFIVTAEPSIDYYAKEQ
jgi:hypothetical protein